MPEGGFDIGSLLENKMFLQYLSGAGAAMSGPGSTAASLNQATQQNITAQNYTAMLKKMLAGGGKMTLDKDKFSLTGSPALLSGDDQGGSQLGSMTQPLSIAPNGGSQGSVIPQSNNVDIMSSILNPSASPLGDLGGADLAGLTPDMISQALQFKFAQDEVGRKSVTDVADMAYKQALTEQARATTAATVAKNAPAFTIPGTDVTLTREQYVDWYKAASKDERTAAIKNYEYAKAKGYKGSFEQFQDTSKTTHQKDYAQAKAEGYEGDFNTWMLDMAKAGAISIGETVARKGAEADIKAVKYFSDPKGLVQDVDKFVNSEDVQNKLFSIDPGKREIETIREKEKFITGKIASSGGKIVSSKLDGRDFVWTVKWPDGNITEVVYAN